MKYITALGFLFGLAAAQSATTTASSSSSTSLPDLVSQLPTCAVSCLSSAADTIGCSATDFSCLCQSQEKLISTLTPCVLMAGCSTTEIEQAAKVAPNICQQVQNNPAASDLASASRLVTGAVGGATGTASPTTTAVPAGGARPTYAYGMLGAVALAAVAL
ncbi:hypothetical protein CCHL11_07217 [Colletotrichum chlorophyti]|uniref:CFEM domain-containing protein n=1 Tax=Colletotrichum chlorophyti TaxID=708187 RepID=A0A1Q8RX65_9PEZI|nr:hypothetical protein CCHL11_07217 [Colletotrichum chlorophyti]